MTGYFQQEGRKLLANGYLIIPILPGEKRPAIGTWQNARLGSGDLDRYPGHGVGVLCGQGTNPIVGVDIDVSHEVVGPALLAWCREHLGHTVERIGAAPRILLAYRATAGGWAKANSLKFFDPADPVKPSGKRNDQQVEVLGLGQQFVAYHIHPDTGQAYEWVDERGGLSAVRADDLPVVTEHQVDALLREVERLVAEVGPGLETVGNLTSMPAGSVGIDDDWFANMSDKTGVTLDQYRAWLLALDNSAAGGFDYDTWLHAGMAGHHEFDGAVAALDVWLEWSERSPKFERATSIAKWASFGRGAGRATTMRWLIKVSNQAAGDRALETRRGALETIRGVIAAATDSTDLTTRVAVRVRGLVPEEAAARAEVLGLFTQRFKTLAGVALPVGEARALLFEKRVPTVNTRRPLTEFGNAERMLDKFGQGLMYVPESDAWYCWTGVYWRLASKIEIEHLAKETVKALGNEFAEHESDAAEFYDFCRVSQQAKMVRSMVMLAASDPRVLVPARELDRDPAYLGVMNGVVHLPTGRLLPPDPEMRLTLTMGCDYVPGAKCPLFESTLADVFSGDEGMVDFVHRIVGYAAAGNPKEDVMLIPFGNGSNGKSTVLNVLRKAFGGYARAAEASSFVSDARGGGGGAGGAREDLVRLRGARFVYVNEPEENSELREGAVKAMTGGDSITARGLYAPASLEITPSWVVFMPTNHKPIVKGSDNGIWRRLVLLPFERNFDLEKGKDPDRQEKLDAERVGVLAWIIEGYAKYRQHGLVQPPSVKAARESYRTQMDLLAEWIEECCEVGPSYTCLASLLWASWENYAKQNGILQYVKSNVALGRRLDGKFKSERDSSGRRVRVGLRLKNSDGDDFFNPGV